MAELLFVTPQEMTSKTILGGNIDIDKIPECILNVQLNVIEPLLGTELYDKIKDDIENTALAGLYQTLFDKFIKPITTQQSVAKYIERCSYTVDNGGIYKHEADNETIPDRQEIEQLSNDYRANADVYVQRFMKWICKNPLPEYKIHQDEVNATKDTQLMNGLYFGSVQDPTKWEREQGIGYGNGCNCKNDLNECCS